MKDRMPKSAPQLAFFAVIKYHEPKELGGQKGSFHCKLQDQWAIMKGSQGRSSNRARLEAGPAVDAVDESWLLPGSHDLLILPCATQVYLFRRGTSPAGWALPYQMPQRLASRQPDRDFFS